jgi:hypothetical protein
VGEPVSAANLRITEEREAERKQQKAAQRAGFFSKCLCGRTSIVANILILCYTSIDPHASVYGLSFFMTQKRRKLTRIPGRSRA